MSGFKKEERYCFTYVKDGETKTIYPRSREACEKNLEICNQKGYEYLGCQKLYPFSMIKNGHNIELWLNRTYLIINAYYTGDKEDEYFPSDVSDTYIENLENKRRYVEDNIWGSGIVWLPYKDWQLANEISEWAVNDRAQKCIESGRLDLLQYCD